MYIEDSGNTKGLGQPFGFLRFSSSANSVNMYVLPYNFPKFFKIFGMFFLYLFSTDLVATATKTKHKLASSSIQREIAEYFEGIPDYYYEVLFFHFLDWLIRSQFMNL